VNETYCIPYNDASLLIISTKA